MKERIGGWKINCEIKNMLCQNPDGALSDIQSRKSFYWVYGSKRQEGDPLVSLYVKTVDKGFESYEIVGARKRSDAVLCLKFESRKQIILAEGR